MARILVIDDSAEMLDLLKIILQERGKHEVLLSADGQTGLALALSERPDLAIVDVMMPDMTGYDVIRRLRGNPTTAHIRTIVLTARGQPIDRRVAAEAGADTFLIKPVETNVLLEKINELLGKTPSKGGALIVGVMGLAGGVGKTTVAVNLALLLQQVGQTLLMDLSPNSGHAALFLGLKPVRHWGFLLENPGLTTESLMQRHDSGLKLLASPPLPLRREGLDAVSLDALFQLLGRNSRFIVVDMPPTLDAAAQLTLERAHRLVMVSSDEPPSIQTAIRTLQLLENVHERMLIVLNTLRPGAHPPLEALQRALPAPICTRLPYDETQALVLRRGSPSVLSQPESPLVAELRRVVKTLLS
ncbi:MAG: response regulator [Anaerolineae bacterium]|nr:response regulator [Anaerolineae bacterium]